MSVRAGAFYFERGLGKRLAGKVAASLVWRERVRSRLFGRIVSAMTQPATSVVASPGRRFESPMVGVITNRIQKRSIRKKLAAGVIMRRHEGCRTGIGQKQLGKRVGRLGVFCRRRHQPRRPAPATL